ncbi:helix-turn-helix transcriptional regulator [Bacteroides sp.]|uniref:helix-turn-helix domain-containing protein n=1 Tax=Bacteroides sp. TaxID=29523 RepID=UPI0026326428|nr:helix-turn-helix transcriptional regulator [Bacteroides sp.]MDD3038611.1 helix-turn-helix transcriptional regulator [Bacteroides sp.]
MNIKEQIQNKGFTISQVAALMTNKNGEKGITQSSLSQIINGNPTLDKLQEIASIIGISVSELVSEGEDEKNTITCPKCGTKFKMEE